MDSTEIILSFKSGDDRRIQSLYGALRPKLIHWLKGKYALADEETARAIYQRSFTILYLNAQKGKLDDLDASVETYLFGVAKNVFREWQRNRGAKMTLVSEDSEMENLKMKAFAGVFDQSELDESLVNKMKHALEKLGDPCQTIIKLFYWEQNSMEAIASKTGYKNEKVAKKKKYICLQKLKELMRN